ncbi:GNAT family N-acetyltransferase [Sphingomonas bacterium]|uniref:GNAT family N-acetyltransferase n=1 Tax=Sphingomonas bacterium TaxID=1895847 RepID=UPI002614B8B0|nr:GNAT family N-acetyltransferase [Sphingomonas bacterium]MDB5678111.1 GCN5-related N-acetyltransferase [Sphingomonas bacterium]
MPHNLDRPVWTALRTGWSRLAEGDARAWRLRPDYGMFGAVADEAPESLAVLATLVPDDGGLLLIERDVPPLPPGTRLAQTPEPIVQMVCDTLTPGFHNDDWVELTEDDAPAMFDLATLTRPGPYMLHTNRLGRFIGVKRGGALVAMAGERMRMPGMTEVSGVCTHPEHRGRGHAATLIRAVARRMLAAGEMPFLHALAANRGAITLYEELGFRHRLNLTASVLVRDI